MATLIGLCIRVKVRRRENEGRQCREREDRGAARTCRTHCQSHSLAVGRQGVGGGRGRQGKASREMAARERVSNTTTRHTHTQFPSLSRFAARKEVTTVERGQQRGDAASRAVPPARPRRRRGCVVVVARRRCRVCCLSLSLLPPVDATHACAPPRRRAPPRLRRVGSCCGRCPAASRRGLAVRSLLLT